MAVRVNEMGLMLKASRGRGMGAGWTEAGEKKERGTEGGDHWAQEAREEEGVGSRPRRGETPDSRFNRNQDRPDRHEAGKPVRNVLPSCLLPARSPGT